MWVVWYSIVHWASVYAASSGWDSKFDLGVQLQINWLERKGMKWSSLLLILWKEVCHWGLPHVIILQLRENDLPEEKDMVLSRTIIADLSSLHNVFPSMMFWFG